MVEPSLRIAFFIPDFSGGGLERMRLVLAGNLLARGHEVTIVARAAQGPLMKNMPARAHLELLNAAGSAQSIIKLRRLLRAKPQDVLVASTPHNALVAALATLGLKVPVLAVQHNTLSEEAARLGGTYRFLPFLFWIMERRWFSILAVSAGVADDLVRTCGLAPESVVVVANPAAPVEDDALDLTILSPAHTAKRFVFIGRLVAQKNPTLALHAFAMSRAAKDGELLFIGDGSLRAHLEHTAETLGIKNSVHFLGFLQDVRPHLKSADALIMTSDYEGFGNVLVEALAMGTPAIATDCPSGPSEILDDGRFGAMFAVGDAGACAALMEQDLRRLYPGSMSRVRAKDFSVERGASILLRELTRAVAPGRTGIATLPENPIEVQTLIQQMMSLTDRFRYVVTINASHIRHMRKSLTEAACTTADVVTIDGAPVAWMRRMLGRRGARITGCAIVQGLAVMAPPGLRISVVVESAATASVLEAWATKSGSQAMWLPVVAPLGLRDNFAAHRRLVAAIEQTNPDILLLTLGAPVSEEFCYRYRESLPPCWGACVGQAIRVLIGLSTRPPLSWQARGLEWAWRLRKEPRRLARRYVLDALWLPIVFARDLISLTHRSATPRQGPERSARPPNVAGFPDATE